MGIHRLLRYCAFGPSEIGTIVAAYQNTLLALGFPDRDTPVTELVAKKIIEISETGELDPERLSAQAISELGIPNAA